MTFDRQPRGVTDDAWRRMALGRVAIAVVLLLADLALLAMAGVAWQAVADDQVSGLSVAPISILGATAAAGLPVSLLLAGANLAAVRARRAGQPPATARPLAAAGLGLALLRLLAVPVAAVAVAVAAGPGAVTGLADACTLTVAAVVALFAVLLAATTGRALRQPAG